MSLQLACSRFRNTHATGQRSGQEERRTNEQQKNTIYAYVYGQETDTYNDKEIKIRARMRRKMGKEREKCKERKKERARKDKQISHTQLVGQEKMSLVFDCWCVKSRSIDNTNKSCPSDIALLNAVQF